VIAKLYQKKSFHPEIQEMLGKSMFILAALLFLKSNHNKYLPSINRVANHSYLFNKSLKWLRQASKEDIKCILTHKEFERFSVTNKNRIDVLYDSNLKTPISSDQVTEIIDVIIKYRNTIKNKKLLSPQVELFQWYDYLERTEIWKEGPVFVFKNKQLTHVWRD
jgi:hypothetical protein